MWLGVTARHHVRLPTPVLLALLLGLLLRAVIPAGFMPAPGEGLPRLVPCTGMTPAMSHHPGDHHPGNELPCAFALVAPPALPGTGPALVPPPALPALRAPTAFEGTAPRPRAILPPPATGPPPA